MGSVLSVHLALAYGRRTCDGQQQLLVIGGLRVNMLQCSVPWQRLPDVQLADPEAIKLHAAFQKCCIRP
jgi:hypothetical protein